LKTNEPLIHRHRTVHIRADMPALCRIAQEALGVDLESVRAVFFSVSKP